MSWIMFWFLGIQFYVCLCVRSNLCLHHHWMFWSWSLISLIDMGLMDPYALISILLWIWLQDGSDLHKEVLIQYVYLMIYNCVHLWSYCFALNIVNVMFVSLSLVYENELPSISLCSYWIDNVTIAFKFHYFGYCCCAHSTQFVQICY